MQWRRYECCAMDNPVYNQNLNDAERKTDIIAVINLIEKAAPINYFRK